MVLLIFGKQDCAKCKTTKSKLTHFLSKWDLAGRVPLQFYDMDTIDGMTEGAFRDVGDVPTTILEDDDQAIARWVGCVPDSSELKSHLGIAG